MTPSLTGVVLAGGLSSRLGHDKVRLRFDGGQSADMLSRSVALLEAVCGKAVVIGREQEGYSCAPDITPGLGPVGGIATALAHCDTACLVVSCDLPFMEEEVLHRLVAHHANRPPGMLSTSYRQKDTGHVEALVAIYESACLPYFQDCVARRLLKISIVVPAEQQYFLEYSSEDSLPFFNINYPADLEIARRMLAMLGR